MAFQHDLLFLRFFNITVFSVSEKIIDLYQSLTFLVVFTLLLALNFVMSLKEHGIYKALPLQVK